MKMVKSLVSKIRGLEFDLVNTGWEGIGVTVRLNNKYIYFCFSSLGDFLN